MTPQDFDLSQYELNDTGVLTVQNARGDADMIGADGKNPVRITLYGAGSDESAKAEHTAANAGAARQIAAFRGKGVKNESEISRADLINKLVAITASIDNFPVEPRALYSNNRLVYIRKQVQEFQAQDANFAKGSVTS